MAPIFPCARPSRRRGSRSPARTATARARGRRPRRPPPAARRGRRSRTASGPAAPLRAPPRDRAPRGWRPARPAAGGPATSPSTSSTQISSPPGAEAARRPTSVLVSPWPWASSTESVARRLSPRVGQRRVQQLAQHQVDDHRVVGRPAHRRAVHPRARRERAPGHRVLDDRLGPPGGDVLGEGVRADAGEAQPPARAPQRAGVDVDQVEPPRPPPEARERQVVAVARADHRDRRPRRDMALQQRPGGRARRPPAPGAAQTARGVAPRIGSHGRGDGGCSSWMGGCPRCPASPLNSGT